MKDKKEAKTKENKGFIPHGIKLEKWIDG